MHELSLMLSVVDAVTESIAAYPDARVLSVRLRIGVLAAVEQESLNFCFEMATADTPLAGARLEVHRQPVVIHCAHCQQDVTLSGCQSLICPQCSTPATNLLHGREMEIESIELDDQLDDEPASAKE